MAQKKNKTDEVAAAPRKRGRPSGPAGSERLRKHLVSREEERLFRVDPSDKNESVREYGRRHKKLKAERDAWRAELTKEKEIEIAERLWNEMTPIEQKRLQESFKKAIKRHRKDRIEADKEVIRTLRKLADDLDLTPSETISHLLNLRYDLTKAAGRRLTRFGAESALTLALETAPDFRKRVKDDIEKFGE